MTVVNEIRKGFYLDSVALMRISRSIVAMPDIEEAGLMIGTPANKQILREAGVLNAIGEGAAPGDLIIAVRAKTEAAAKACLVEAASLLDAPRRTSAGAAWRPRTPSSSCMARAPPTRSACFGRRWTCSKGAPSCR